MAPRKLDPSPCACGCGEMTKTGQFKPGHDQKLRAAIEQAAGGLLELQRIVADYLGRPVIPARKDHKACPECGHVFQGNGWDGIDAHWRAKHEHIMPYAQAWPLIKAGSYRPMK